jgi:hypothetical protein
VPKHATRLPELLDDPFLPLRFVIGKRDNTRAQEECRLDVGIGYEKSNRVAEPDKDWANTTEAGW